MPNLWERLLGLANSMTDNRTQGPGVRGVFRSALGTSVGKSCCSSQALLQGAFASLTFTETPAASAGHLTEMRSDTFFPFFIYLEDINSS